MSIIVTLTFCFFIGFWEAQASNSYSLRESGWAFFAEGVPNPYSSPSAGLTELTPDCVPQRKQCLKWKYVFGKWRCIKFGYSICSVDHALGNQTSEIDCTFSSFISHILYGEVAKTKFCLQQNGTKAILNDIDQNTRFTPLMLAIHQKDVELFDDLLSLGASPSKSVKQRNYMTPLHLASSDGNLEMVKKLLKHGADLDPQTISGITPLWLAVFNRRYRVAKFLLSMGANPNNRNVPRIHSAHDFGEDFLSNDFSATTLFVAAQQGYKDIVKLLIKYKADVNLTRHDSNSPLTFAIKKNNDTIITKALVEAGADVNQGNYHNENPMILAVRNNNTAAVKYLAPRVDFFQGKNSLLEAAILNNTDIFITIANHSSQNFVDETFFLMSDLENIHYSKMLFYDFNANPSKEQTYETYDKTYSYINASSVAFIRSAASGAILMHKFLLSIGVTSNFTYSSDYQLSAYGNAVCRNQLEILKLYPNDTWLQIDDPYGRPYIWIAVFCKATKTLDYYLSLNLSSQSKDNYLMTPLHAAAMSHFSSRYFNLTYTSLLETEDSNAIESRTNLGMSPLHIMLLFSSFYNIEKNIDILVHKQADINSRDIMGRTVLHNLAFLGFTNSRSTLNSEYITSSYGLVEYDAILKLFSLLVNDYNASVNLSDENGVFPIDLAFQERNYAEAQALLEVGAVDRLNRTIPKDLPKEKLILLPKNWSNLGPHIYHEIFTQNSFKNIVLAARFGSLEDVMDFPIDHINDVDEETFDNTVTALFAAAIRGNIKIVNYLLANGANPNFVSNDGNTPLLMATRNMFEDIVSSLLKFNATDDFKDQKEFTALMWAVHRNWMKGAEILIQSGSNLNVASCQGDPFTPLLLSITNYNIPIMKLLLQSGADANFQVLCGENVAVSPIMKAISFNIFPRNREKDEIPFEITKILIDHGGNVNARGPCNNTPLLYATAGWGKVFWLKYLVSHGANIHDRDNNNSTALINSAFDHEKVEYLISVGANVNDTDIWGRSCLHYAAKFNNYIAIGILIQNGAAINEQDVNGETPLSLAITEGIRNEKSWSNFGDNSKSNDNTILTLINAGANIKIRNNNGRTPFQEMIKHGKTDGSAFVILSVLDKL